MTQLRTMYIDRLFKTGGFGLRAIKALTNLEFLSLIHANINDFDLMMFDSLTNLKELNLEGCCAITGEGFRKPLPRLVTFILNTCSISDSGLRSIACFSSVQSLFLMGCLQISDEGLSHLSSLTTLRLLSLAQTRVTNEGVRHLSSLTQLEDLVITNTSVRNLRALGLPRVQVVSRRE